MRFRNSAISISLYISLHIEQILHLFDARSSVGCIVSLCIGIFVFCVCESAESRQWQTLSNQGIEVSAFTQALIRYMQTQYTTRDCLKNDERVTVAKPSFVAPND